MTAAKSDLRKYLDQAGELPRDVLLGHVVMFTITDGEYDREQVALWFDELNLNPAFVPSPNKAIDAFKKATSLVDDTEYDVRGNTAHVLVRDVASDTETMTRHFIREITDSRKKRLAYSKIGEATFYRAATRGGKVQPGTERLRLGFDADSLYKEETTNVQELRQRIDAAYDRHVKFMDGMKVRAMVRDYVLSLNAILLKQGVYFVHVNRLDELLRLQTLVQKLGGCRLELMPLVDLKEQRDMVVEAFQTEAEASLTDVVKAITHIRETRKKVTPDAYAKVKREYDDVMLRAKEYGRTLKVNQDRTAGAAEFALEALAALQAQMLEG